MSGTPEFFGELIFALHFSHIRHPSGKFGIYRLQIFFDIIREIIDLLTIQSVVTQVDWKVSSTSSLIIMSLVTPLTITEYFKANANHPSATALTSCHRTELCVRAYTSCRRFRQTAPSGTSGSHTRTIRFENTVNLTDTVRSHPSPACTGTNCIEEVTNG